MLLTELRQQGAFATASEKFLEELDDTRETGRNRRKAERLAARAAAAA